MHPFDCLCNDCTAKDVVTQSRPVGFDLFNRKARTAPVITTATQTVKTEPIRRLPAGQVVGRGRVRQISSKQENYILRLLGERDITDLKLVTGQSIDPNEIPFMGIKGASALIEKLLGCPIKGTNSPVPNKDEFTLPGSPKQVALIKSLATERNLSESDLKIMFKARPSARLLIDALFAMPKPNKAVILKAEIEKATSNEEYIPTEIIPGFYRDSNNDVWKVQFNQSKTGMYALKRITAKKYEYTAGAIKSLTPQMFVSINPIDITLEEAKEYGRRTGTCYMCQRTLTKKESIENGIGPICANKF